MSANSYSHTVASLIFAAMKSKWTLLWIVICGTLFFSAGSIIISGGERPDLMEKRAALVMREIGHKILLHAGDSSSRVLPVKKINDLLFQIEFQSPFAFVPDTLVSVVHQSLSSANLPLYYLVNVFDCNNKQIIYGYEMRLKENNIVACLGRVQPVGCYIIRIEFTEGETLAHSHIPYYVLMMISAGLGLFAFISKGSFKKEKSKPVSTEDDSLMHVGKYTFSFDKRVLKNDKENIELSDKETRLLKIFATHQNEVIERERLMKEVWEDEGVFVGRSLDMFVSKLRKKLQNDTSVKLINIHGKGYKLETERE